MPLEDLLPPIDDRSYESLRDEIRTRIARYTPEWQPVWTDVNDSDPGITIVQVFAWLAEMLTYRMGKVPALNYIKFLQLLGIELRPAEPARAEIIFPVTKDHPEPYVIVPARTQVSAQASDGGSPVVFETTRALIALTAPLTSVQVFDGYSFTLKTSENEAALAGFQPFGPLAKDDCALLLGFDSASDLPVAEIDLAFSIVESEGATARAACGLPDAPAYASAQIAWEGWTGTAWLAMSLLSDDTRALTRSGHVRLKKPRTVTLRPDMMGAELPDRTPLVWLRARLFRAQYERPPRLLAIRTNTAAAEQAETTVGEVLGGSNGRRDQVFRLASVPVLRDSAEIEVDEGDGFLPWTRVDDFFGSSATDRHYVLNRTTGEVRFGDGTAGAIPVANEANPDANVVARRYRSGGRKRGNVAAKALKTMVTTVAGIDEGKVQNLAAAYGGSEEETLEEAKLRAPRAIKARCRAVTAEDFEMLAKETANVRRAKALPRFHPDFPDVDVPGAITLIVVPDSDSPTPTPSEGTLRSVCAYLDPRRLLTAELYVIPPTYQRVEVRTEVVVADDADLAEVREAIDAGLVEYFHPLRGGDDGLGWPFGGTILHSRVNHRVLSVSGVQSVPTLVLVLDGEEMPECRDVPLGRHALLYSGQHEIDAGYRFESLDE